VKKKNKWNKFLLLNWKKLLIIVIAWILAFVLHNLISALIGLNGEEPFFFIIAVIVIPLYFIICLVYTLIIYILKKQNK